ncbi:histidine kinase [Pseudonocardia xinjiangensis]|uniref:ATP-dependent DNA ligase n=1 Tax=Pseudonocardia xinjiangensis TaxID=75289 RepID=UPI003D92FB8C
MTGGPTSGELPDLVPPMQAASVAGDPPVGPDWVVEVAWTGHRCIAYVQPGRRVRLLSGGNNSMSAAYPELSEPLLRRSPPGGMVLDGTLVARGEEHAMRPRLLKRRSARHRPSDETIRRIPVDFQVADLLWLDGHSTTDLHYADRRALLDGLGFASPPVWTTSPLPATELDTMLAIADQKGAEGLHARHLRGRYHPGGRSRFWLRVPIRRTRQVLVGGWTPADPRRPDTVGTLLLGVPVGGGLHYVGRVGVSLEQRRQLAAELVARRLPKRPFSGEVPADAGRHASWAAPELVGLVEFTGWIGGGRMRRPHWRGLLAPSAVQQAGWARPPEPVIETPAPELAPPVEPAVATSPGPASSGPAAPEPVAAEPGAGEPAAAGQVVQARRLEQHFVYNSLNTIAALIRTDPMRARELLFGFADLSRVADLPGTSTLGRELDAVRGYLQLEQARFGERLRVEVDVESGVEPVPVSAMQVLDVVRSAVQQEIEPLPDGGTLALVARRTAAGCAITVTAGERAPTTLLLAAPPD